jgi:gas vesicle protein
MMDNERLISWIGIFLLGGLVGASIAMLMAPQSGRKTRGMIADKGVELKDRAMGTVEETKHKAEQLASSTMEKVSSLRNRGQETLEETAEDIRNHAKNARDSMSRS